MKGTERKRVGQADGTLEQLAETHRNLSENMLEA
jgi:hypothetical protein